MDNIPLLWHKIHSILNKGSFHVNSVRDPRLKFWFWYINEEESQNIKCHAWICCRGRSKLLFHLNFHLTFGAKLHGERERWQHPCYFYTEISRSLVDLLLHYMLTVTLFALSPKVCMSFIIFWFLTDFSFGIFIFQAP